MKAVYQQYCSVKSDLYFDGSVNVLDLNTLKINTVPHSDVLVHFKNFVNIKPFIRGKSFTVDSTLDTLDSCYKKMKSISGVSKMGRDYFVLLGVKRVIRFDNKFLPLVGDNYISVYVDDIEVYFAPMNIDNQINRLYLPYRLENLFVFKFFLNADICLYLFFDNNILVGTATRTVIDSGYVDKFDVDCSTIAKYKLLGKQILY